MPKQATNSFEMKYKNFDIAASQEVVPRRGILARLTYLEKEGIKQTREGELDRDVFVKKMHFAFARVIDLNEQGIIEPPLIPSKVTELTEKSDLYEVLAPNEDQVPTASPSPIDSIPTSKQKK